MLDVCSYLSNNHVTTPLQNYNDLHTVFAASSTIIITRSNTLAERMSTVRPLLQFTPLLTNNTAYGQGYSAFMTLVTPE
jgi:hypothetical protein